MKNYLDFKKQLEEKHLTAAEKNKREEIAQAIEKKNPGMPKEKKMAIATAQAKKVAEEYEKLMAEMKELGLEEKDLEEGIKDDLWTAAREVSPWIKGVTDKAIRGIGDTIKSTKNALGFGAKEVKPATSAVDDFRAPSTPRAPDDPMGVQGPVVTKPFKDTDAAKEFTQKELDRIQKAVTKNADEVKPTPDNVVKMPKAEPLKVEPPKAETPKAANDDIKPAPVSAPKKPTQPRDAGGRFTKAEPPKAADDIKPPPKTVDNAASTAVKAADDIKPPAPIKAPDSLRTRIGKGAAVVGGAAALGAVAGALDSTRDSSSSAGETPAAPKTAEPPKTPEAPKASAPAAETPKTSTPEAPKTDKPNYDSMTFGQAFSTARKAATEKGVQSTGRFNWRGKEYQTNVKGEKYVTRNKQTAVGESFEVLPEGSIDEAILKALAEVKK